MWTPQRQIRSHSPSRPVPVRLSRMTSITRSPSHFLTLTPQLSHSAHLHFNTGHLLAPGPTAIHAKLADFLAGPGAGCRTVHPYRAVPAVMGHG